MNTSLSTIGRHPKLLTLQDAVKNRLELKKSGKQLVLTNGCFDLLHPGHLQYLSQAKALGDTLWVALNSTSSVQQLKGLKRPIFNDEERAYALGSLESVDAIIIFNEERLTKEILAIKPDIYVKAGDYTLETLNPEERQALQACHTKITFMPFVPGYSTTKLIEKIINS